MGYYDRNKPKTGELTGRSFYMSVDYDTYYACRNGSDCCDNDYCRCGVINNARIEEKYLSTEDVMNTVFNRKDLSEIDAYCLERVYAAYKVWDADNWEVQVTGGYYGQEIGGCYFNTNEALKIDAAANALLALKTTRAKIEYILTLEYGHLLESVKDKRWSVKEVSKDKIHFGQEDHYRKLDRTVVDRYVEYNLPRGICLFKDGKYRVIDGYHRISAGGNEVKIICANAD